MVCMTKLWVLVILITLTMLTQVFIGNSSAANSPNCYVGITFGGTTVDEAKQLIDQVKSYMNLFVVASWTINGGPTADGLTEICDYATAANMHVIVYFNFIYQNYTGSIGSRYNSTTWDDYKMTPWHRDWLNQAKDRYGDKFLGAYLYDEPGGKQIDCGYWNKNNSTFAGTPIMIYRNATTYDDVARIFTSNIARSGSMQVLTNTTYRYNLTHTVPVFTSDYALFWFDYKAGFSTVFTEIGELHEQNRKIEQIALCRGAANAQHKDWGAIITFASYNPITPEDGTTLLNDMTMAYEAGAKYVIIFNYVVDGQCFFTDEQFNAMKQFWDNIHASPERRGIYSGQVAFVLPNNYGWGLRAPHDKIWGFWPADNQSSQIWNNMNALIDKYGLNLDIVYDDPQVDIQGLYGKTYLWNSTLNLNDENFASQPYVYIPLVGFVGTVAGVSTYWVTKRKKQNPPKPPSAPTPQPKVMTTQAPIVLIQQTEQRPQRPKSMIKLKVDLNPIFDSFAQTIDPLFDILGALHGRVNWQIVTDSVEQCKFSKVIGAKEAIGNLDFHNLTLAVKQQQPQVAAQECRALMKTLHANLSTLATENQNKETQPSYSTLKDAVESYVLLNDFLLGQVLGDAQAEKERTALTTVLEGYIEQVDEDGFTELVETLRKGAVLDVTDSRTLVRNALKQTLN